MDNSNLSHEQSSHFEAPHETVDLLNINHLPSGLNTKSSHSTKNVNLVLPVVISVVFMVRKIRGGISKS